jgi:hypothetical protein
MSRPDLHIVKSPPRVPLEGGMVSVDLELMGVSYAEYALECEERAAHTENSNLRRIGRILRVIK